MEKLKSGDVPNRWYSCCPSHEDDKPSLSIRYDSSKSALTFKCHGPGCSRESIMRDLGFVKHNGDIDWSVLFASSNGRTAGKDWIPVSTEVASYRYVDESGKLLYESVRFDPKDFRFRRPNPTYDPKLKKGRDSNEKLWNLSGVRLILYRTHWLANIFEREPERVVYVVEGEKNVDILWKFGFVATCNPMGAGSWKEQFGDQLAGRNVIVIPDEDPPDVRTGERPGIKHAIDVCNDLSGKASSLSFLRLPIPPNSKQDVYDWITSRQASGSSTDAISNELVKLSNGAEKWSESLRDSLCGQNHVKGLESLSEMVLDLLSDVSSHEDVQRIEHSLGELYSSFELLKAQITRSNLNRESLRKTIAAHGLSLARLSGFLIDLERRESK